MYLPAARTQVSQQCPATMQTRVLCALGPSQTQVHKVSPEGLCFSLSFLSNNFYKFFKHFLLFLEILCHSQMATPLPGLKVGTQLTLLSSHAMNSVCSSCLALLTSALLAFLTVSNVVHTYVLDVLALYTCFHPKSAIFFYTSCLGLWQIWVETFEWGFSRKQI